MKRSSQVALLLMGTVAVGGGAYAIMPHENNCQPGVVQPDGQLSQASQNCNRSSSGSSSSGWRGGGGSSGWSSSSTSSSSPSYFASDGRSGTGSSSSGDHSSSSSSVSRGGFGSFASHFSGGG